MGTDEFIGKHSKSLKNIIDKLIKQTFADTFLAAWPMDYLLKHYREKGLPIPNDCKPGYLVKKLSEEEREVLKTCTEKDFNQRIK
jgi:hypothetical protein